MMSSPTPSDIETPPSQSGLIPRSVVLLTVGLDAVTLSQVAETVRADRFLRVESMEGLDVARKFIDATPSTAMIVLIEHTLLDRVLAFPEHVHVIALTGPGQETKLDAGIDEYLARPIRPTELRARLRVAARALASAGAGTINVLLDALASGRSGEVIVAFGDESARIHIERGNIAWVHRSQHPASIRQLVELAGGAIDDDTVRDIVEQSRESRRHFAETIIEWKIVAPDQMRDTLRRHLMGELAAVQGWMGATATFVADKRASTTSLPFTAAELGVEARSTSRVATVTSMVATAARATLEPARVERWLERVVGIEHVRGGAVLDLATGAVHGSLGLLASQMDTVWELARAFHALGEDRDELLTTAKQWAFLVRSVPDTPTAAFVVNFDANQISPAMARILVSKAGPI